jgi:hypothetical protein
MDSRYGLSRLGRPRVIASKLSRVLSASMRKQRIAVAAPWDGQRLPRLKTDLLDNVTA